LFGAFCFFIIVDF